MVCSIFIDLWSFLKTEAAPLTVLTAVLGIIFAVLNLMKLVSDSRERTRPYIALEPRPGVHLNGSVDLVVTNYGQSTAQNITLKPLEPLDPGENEYILPLLNKLFERSFYMAPHASFRLMWRSVASGGKCGAPEVCQVEVVYQSTKANWLRKQKTYKEIVIVDTGFIVAAPEPVDGANTAGSGTPEQKALKNINLALRTLNQHIANRY